VGAVFVAIGNNIYAQANVPYSSQLTLTGMINAIGYGTFLLALIQCAISLYVFDTMGRERLSRYFDKISFAVFLIGYAVTNLILPFAAMP
jgi:heme/copper-type cytochrome/quinol oxidase subunit 4